MRPVIFDTDIGIDDAMALLFLHCARSVELTAITTRFGNASIEDTTRNALHMAEKFAIGAPVFRGAAAPLGRRLGEGYPQHVHGKNGLGDIEFDSPETETEALSAAEAIVELSRRASEKTTIIAVGGLTNIALALELDPGISERIDDVIVMGGAFGYNGHRGNVSPVAEANIASDPLAADRVFVSELPTTIIGLDVTHEVVMDESVLELLATRAGKTGQFIKATNQYYFDFHQSLGGNRASPLHDSCAVAYYLQPELFETISQPVRVVTDGIAIGQTIHGNDLREYVSEAWDGAARSKIATAVNAEAILDLLVSTLVSGSADHKSSL